MQPEQRTKVKDIPVCNDRIIKETARINKVPAKDVDEIARFVGEYIGNVIREGKMQTVMIPYFGKFKPNKKRIRALAKIAAQKANGMDPLYKALKGKRLPKKITDETI